MDRLVLPDLRLVPMTREHAAAVVTWRYPAPYDVYDMTGASVEELLDPALCFHAVLSGDELVGYRSFGVDGRVPGWEYDDTALDTGGGLRPDLTGHGYGRAVIAAGLEYGRLTYRPQAFRVTVAELNLRALAVVRSLGFEEIGRFESLKGARPYVVLVRSARGLRS